MVAAQSAYTPEKIVTPRIQQFFMPVLVALILAPAASCANDGSGSLSAPANLHPDCTDWSIHKLGRYEIANNVWGKGAIRNYKQCIFGSLNSNSGLSKSMGWSWRWPKVADGVKAYPSILYGKKPWNDYSTSRLLPQEIQRLDNLMVTYKVKLKSSGAVNLLLESWITKTKQAKPHERVGEVAVQLYQKNWPGQAGRFIEPVVIDGIKFDFYMEKRMHVTGDRDTWVYYGFVHKGRPVYQARLDMMKFVNYLVQHKYLNRHHYLASVELGNEVDHGEGRTEIEHFSVSVRKRKPSG